MKLHWDKMREHVIVDDGISVMAVPATEANADYAAMLASGVTIREYEDPAPSKSSINAERDKRLASFWFGGHEYQHDDKSRAAIEALKTDALAAIVEGSTEPFDWVTADNKIIQMAPDTALAFASAASKWRSMHIIAARRLKNAQTVPADYQDDKYWTQQAAEEGS
jgi:hypothetical protein